MCMILTLLLFFLFVPNQSRTNLFCHVFRTIKNSHPWYGLLLLCLWHGHSRPGGLEHDNCRLLRHLSCAWMTLDFQERGLDGAGRDVDEYKRISARTFRHILMNCTFLLALTGLRQRLPDPLPELPRDQRDLRRVQCCSVVLPLFCSILFCIAPQSELN
jgi:hypothetical protein